MRKIALIPREGETGVIMFYKGIRRRWFFWVKPEFTADVNEAKTFDSNYDAQVVIDVLYTCNLDKTIVIFDNMLVDEYQYNRFWVIERVCGDYYSHDDIQRIGKVAKPVPQYTSDIMDADFLKSVEMATQTLMRIRQTSKDRVRARMVYLTEKNDFTIPFILFALTNKNTKRTRYLKGYDIEGKSSDRVFFVDSMEKAWKVDVNTAIKVVDDIHAKHKTFVVNTHIYDGTDIPADKYKVKKSQMFSDFKFKKK